MMYFALVLIMILISGLSYKFGKAMALAELDDVNVIRVLCLIEEELEDVYESKFDTEAEDITEYQQGFVSCMDNVEIIVDSKIKKILSGVL